MTKSEHKFRFTVDDNNVLAVLCGPLESHLAHLEIAFNVQLFRKGNSIFIESCDSNGLELENILKFLCDKIAEGTIIQISDIDDAVNRFSKERYSKKANAVRAIAESKVDRKHKTLESLEILSKKKVLHPRTETQNLYLKLLLTKEIIFGMGSAGLVKLI